MGQKPSAPAVQEPALNRDPRGLVAGDANIGKTSLIRALTGGKWRPGARPTIGTDMLTRTAADGTVQLHLFDVGGRENYRAVQHLYYRGADFVVVAYAVDSRASFSRAGEFFEAARDNARPGAQLFLAALRQDLETERQVTEDEGRALADFWGASYAAVSAKSGFGVEELGEALPSPPVRPAGAGRTPSPPVRTAGVGRTPTPR